MSAPESTAPVVALSSGEVVADVSAPLGKPNRKTVSTVWLLIVGANVLVMVIAAIALACALFLPASPSLVEPSMMLVLFSTPAAFLAGLIARDPGQHS